jgi:hypothetical protein
MFCLVFCVDLITGSTLFNCTSLRSLNLRFNHTFTNRSLELLTWLSAVDVTRNARIDVKWFSEYRPQISFVQLP